MNIYDDYLPRDKYDFERAGQIDIMECHLCNFGYKKCVSPGLEERIFLILQLSQIVLQFIRSQEETRWKETYMLKFSKGVIV